MERKIKLKEGEFYHIYNRGVDKRTIFQDDRDYERFLALLYIANSEETIHLSNDFPKKTPLDEIFKKDRGGQIVAIGAYCLMPNHFHLLLTPLVTDGISKFMQKLQTGYSMYFNKKNERNGSLFQGVFKSEHINNDRYFKYIYSYIHLNPSKLKNSKWKEQQKTFLNQLKKFISEYKYSSLQEYISSEFKILDPKFFPLDLKQVIDYKTMVDDFSAPLQKPSRTHLDGFL